MQIVRIGLDLAKYVFHLHGVDERDKVILRKGTAAGSCRLSLQTFLPVLLEWRPLMARTTGPRRSLSWGMTFD